MRVIKIAAICLLVLLLYFLRDTIGRLVLLLLVSATIAYLIDPIARRLPFGSGASAGVAFLLVVALLAGLLYFAVPALIRQFISVKDALPRIFNSLAQLLENIRLQLTGLGVTKESIESMERQTTEIFGKAATSAAQGLMNFGNSISSMGYMVLAPVIAFYMVKDKRMLFDFMQRLIPHKARRRTMELGLSIKAEIGDYVKGQLTVSLITGAITAIGLLFIGMPTWLVLGLSMVVCNLIPYFGPWLGALPIIIFSIPNGLSMTLFSVLVVLIAQLVENIFVSPRIIGQAAHLHPTVVIIALIAGSMIFGLAGLFFAIPAVLTLRASIRTIRDAQMRSMSKNI